MTSQREAFEKWIELQTHDGYKDWDIWQAAKADQAETIAQLKLKNTRLRDALQLLLDNQNGCPLPKYEIDWNEAMRLSYELLGETK